MVVNSRSFRRRSNPDRGRRKDCRAVISPGIGSSALHREPEVPQTAFGQQDGNNKDNYRGQSSKGRQTHNGIEEWGLLPHWGAECGSPAGLPRNSIGDWKSIGPCNSIGLPRPVAGCSLRLLRSMSDELLQWVRIDNFPSDFCTNRGLFRVIPQDLADFSGLQC